MKAWIGIDPGTVGGWGVVTQEGYQCAQIDDPWQFLSDMAKVKRDNTIVLCALERGQAMPKQGVSSTFKYGLACGRIEGILIALGIPFRTVRPSDWMRGLPKGKDAHIQAARAMFPLVDLAKAKHQHQAEALLLADWARRQR